jgi:hypothetical protein
MSLDVFDRTVAGQTGWMLVEGHEPSARWHARELPPVPEASRALRTVPDASDEASRPIRKRLRTHLHERLARGS